MTPFPAQSVFATIKQIPGLANLDDRVIERLALHSREVALTTGEALTRRGQPQTRLSLVQGGSLEISIHGREGKRHVIRYLRQGEVFGLIPVLDGGGAVHDADAHEDTRLVQIPRDVLLAELNAQPALAVQLLQLFCGRFRQLYELLAYQQLLSLNARVAHLILCLVSVEPQVPAAQRPETFEIHMTQSDMSDMLGVSRQSLSAELKKLERLALIRLAHAKLVVTDPGGLERIAAGSV
ncbi:Crp/Fnr family transcriptional regulator [Variovorax sp. dw_954]|uniref:Crp/Fnr family transcriptional regulator n=1 Tax=Variovorax sp. dw_954 TaxID=2720078 RepID=UPI001BD54D35|nr:Crp/Fnr family transcriptional regulator [Variovorax sp. dw_954]